LLKAGCDDLGDSGIDNTFGYGRINIYWSLSGQNGAVWVDFAYDGDFEFGLFRFPFNTIAEGVEAVPVGGLVNVKAGSSSERPTITKPLTIRSWNGPVVIGE
jgi:hypothetical protein